MRNETDRTRQAVTMRPIEELDLLEDFLTNQMIIHPVVGLRFSKRVLTTIFGREIGTLSIAAQKAYPGENTDRRGIRLDVCLDEHGGDIVDLEPDQNSSAEDVKSLPRRVRFYHAKIDAGSLARGMEYSALRNVVVIFITTYDPFGLNRMVYTISSKCEEVPDMPYDDGAKTLFLYTKGTEGNPPEALKQLLHYMEDTRTENAVTPELRELHEMVTQVKCDKEVGLAYMKAYEIEQRLLRQGREEGRVEGKEEGKEETLLQKIITKVKKGDNVPEIAEALDEDEESISRRVEIISRYAPEYDLEAILDEVLDGKKEARG